MLGNLVKKKNSPCKALDRPLNIVKSTVKMLDTDKDLVILVDKKVCTCTTTALYTMYIVHSMQNFSVHKIPRRDTKFAKMYSIQQSMLGEIKFPTMKCAQLDLPF